MDTQTYTHTHTRLQTHGHGHTRARTQIHTHTHTHTMALQGSNPSAVVGGQILRVGVSHMIQAHDVMDGMAVIASRLLVSPEVSLSLSLSLSLLSFLSRSLAFSPVFVYNDIR